MIEPVDRAAAEEARAQKRRTNYLSLIAIWQLLTVAAAGYVLLWFVTVTFMSYSERAYFGQAGQWWGIEALGAAVIELVLGLGFIVPTLAAAGGLLGRREWGRKLSVLHAILSLILFPIGTVVGALALRYLTRKDIKGHFAAGGQR